ncbi:MAG: macro domain-containing protein [Bacteroidales bacterium]|nr:macro domain-containing protein [Bacteroidales bacterium]
MIKVITGNIFTSKCQTIVNTINCVGAMGKGVAFEYKLRYPEMCEKYVELCKEHLITIGKLWLYKAQDRWILNFPTKFHWKYPSKEEYLLKGLRKFVETYQEKQITSIAFPLLGASNGGLSEEISMALMKEYLSKCDDIDIEIYKYDPNVNDDLYLDFKKFWLSHSDDTLSKSSGMRPQYVRLIRDTLNRKDVHAMNQLLRTRGIGEDTLEKAFRTARRLSTQSSLQL